MCDKTPLGLLRELLVKLELTDEEKKRLIKPAIKPAKSRAEYMREYRLKNRIERNNLVRRYNKHTIRKAIEELALKGHSNREIAIFTGYTESTVITYKYRKKAG